MSEFNEELLNDDTDDFPELGEADEDALLQDDDDGDVLNLAPEEELTETGEADHRYATEVEEKRGSRQDKFATERQRITAPESSANEKANENKFGRYNNRGRFRGRGGRKQQFNQNRQFNNQGVQRGRNKTVFINPRFQGTAHVNNNARLAWDTQQQFQPCPWISGNPPANTSSSMQQMQVMPPHPQMQGPPQMQFQPPMQQFPLPQVHAVQRPMHVQQMLQGPPIQNMGHPGQQQMHFSGPQQEFMPQPLPPGVLQPPMQPPNLLNPSLYWDGQNQVATIPQGPNQQIVPYMQNNFEPPPPVTMTPNRPPPQMHMQNYPFNNQFNNGLRMQQPQQNMNRNFVRQNNEGFVNNRNNMRPPHGNKKELFSPKRKIHTAAFAQNKKRFVHARLGNVEQLHDQIQVKNLTIKTENRPSVVKEVTVTNVTTVKIEEDEETRDLRLKIEEQKRKREALLRWKELRRRENLQDSANQQIKPVQSHMNQGQGRGRGQIRGLHQNVGGSARTPVLQPIKQIDDQKQIKGRGRNQRPVQDVSQRTIIVPVVAKTPAVPEEEAEVHLDEKHLSSFLADRKVLVKDEALLTTRQVVIKNISTSTPDRKIFQICKSIGEVQKLHRDKNDLHATITFKSVASAHAFFKKYQRHMLDLSMIEVSLTPESEEKD